MKICIQSSNASRVEEIRDFELSHDFHFSFLHDVLVEIKNDNIFIYSKSGSDVIKKDQFIYSNFDNAPSNKQVICIDYGLLLHVFFRDIYFHWIYEILPQLSILDSNPEICLITLPIKYNFQNETLGLLCNSEIVTSENYLYKVNKLYLPFDSLYNLMPHPFVFNYLRRIYFSEKKINNKIYITRRGKFKRSIINEKYLIRELKKVGVVVYCLEEIPFLEQIKIFQNASLIISAHGSGLTNIVFCNSNTVILEIYGPGCGERCFARISNYLSLNYFAFEVKAKSYVTIFHRLYYLIFPQFDRYDFKLNISKFKIYIKSLISTQSL